MKLEDAVDRLPGKTGTISNTFGENGADEVFVKVTSDTSYWLYKHKLNWKEGQPIHPDLLGTFTSVEDVNTYLAQQPLAGYNPENWVIDQENDTLPRKSQA